MKKITAFWSFVKNFARAHKFLSAVIALILLGGGYWVFGRGSNIAVITYTYGTVQQGTLTSTVSASGQVASLDEVDIKPKVAGDVVWVGVAAGDTVKAGQALAQLDMTDAKQAVADAQQSLNQAKLQYQKDEAQAPIDYQKAVEAVDDAKQDLATTYTDTFTTVSNTYLNLPAVMTGLNDVLFGYDLSSNKSQWNVDAIVNLVKYGDTEWNTINAFADKAKSDYDTARNLYDANLLTYKSLTRYSSTDDLETNLNSSVEMTTAIAQSLQSTLNLLDSGIDYAERHDSNLDTTITSLRSSAQGYLVTANSTLSSLLSQQKSLDSAKKAVRDDQRSLDILQIGNTTGDNPISLQSSAYDIADKERSLQTLKDNLSDYVITAPFAGTIASFDIKKYDSVTTGTTAATLITNQQVANLSLNEVDAAKISLGDKATLTFDAIEGLTLTGEVTKIDTVGAVSSGVVSYDIQIAFDSQNAAVKPGMTVNATIITGRSADILIVPISAVHTQNGTAYVQIVPDATAANVEQTFQNVTVTTGLSDDTNIEITSGLTEGQSIVVKSTNTSVTATTQSSGSLFGGGGGGRF